MTCELINGAQGTAEKYDVILAAFGLNRFPSYKNKGLAEGGLLPDCNPDIHEEPQSQRQEIKAGPGTVWPFSASPSGLSFYRAKGKKRNRVLTLSHD